MNSIQKKNQKYWNDNATEWFGSTALPTYGVKFETEDQLKLFDNIEGKTVLDIGCGSGHSLKYCADRGAEELWGLDISNEQLDLASNYLLSHDYKASLINTTMEECHLLPHDHFDIIYSIYAIGWSTDLETTFKNIYDMLKPSGSFIFSWQHPLHRCVQMDGDKWVIKHSYHNESYYDLEIDQQPVRLSTRKLSTFINHLVKAGLTIEHVSESSDADLLSDDSKVDPKSEKAKLVPLSFVIKARRI